MADDQSRRDRFAAETAIFQREDKALFDTLCALYSLYFLRRATVEEQKFWNHFWHTWERKNHVNAMRQAFADMSKDPYFPSVSYNIDPNVFTFCNFERYVTSDVKQYTKCVEALWNTHSVNMSLPFSRLDSSTQSAGVDYPLNPDDAIRLLCGLKDHEDIRLALTRKLESPAMSPDDEDRNNDCEGVSSDSDVASNDSEQKERDPENAGDASEGVNVVEITPEEIERRKRNAELLRIRVLERAAKREKKEAAEREKRQMDDERKRAAMDKAFKARDYEGFLKLHMKRMNTEASYRWGYMDQESMEYIELKAKVDKALKFAPPTQTDSPGKTTKKEKASGKQRKQPAHYVKPQPVPAVPEITKPLTYESEPEVPEQKLPAQPETKMPVPELPESKLPESKLAAQDMPEPELPESELPEPKLSAQDMPEPKLPEHKVAADDNCGSTGIEHIAQELHEPEIKETVTNKSEDKVPEEEEKKRPKQNIFVRAIKKLFGKTFG